MNVKSYWRSVEYFEIL